MHRAIMHWASLAVVALALGFVLHVFVVMGLVVPVHISGSSMAPGLLGPHADVTCPNCSTVISVGSDQWPRAGAQSRCVTCGHHFAIPVAMPDGGRWQPGTHVWVDRASLSVRLPRRWEAVVFHCPSDATILCVKRVLGLPGESVAIDDGDLWIDGQRVAKSLAEQVAVRLLVHKEGEALRFWKAVTDTATWNATGWQVDGSSAHSQIDLRPPLGQVTDDLACNQSLRHRTTAVADLMIECRATLTEGARLTLRDDLGMRFPAVNETGDKLVTWSLIDHQLLLAIDGRVVWQSSWPDDWEPGKLSLVVEGGVAALHDLTLYRDIYYQWRPSDRRPAKVWRLPSDHYFVVGDNQSISDDSRSWPHAAGLPIEQIIGTLCGRTTE